MTPAFDGRIHELDLRGNRLYVSGRFMTINQQSYPLLAALNPTTGAVDPAVRVDIAVPRPNRPGTTLAIGGADVSPDGTRMMVIGNFTQMNGLPRYQIGMIDLTTNPVSVANWRTTEYDDGCSGSFASYMRDVQFSPDGGFFVVVTTGAFSGGYGVRTLCDTRYAVALDGDRRGSPADVGQLHRGRHLDLRRRDRLVGLRGRPRTLVEQPLPQRRRRARGDLPRGPDGARLPRRGTPQLAPGT